VLIIVIRKGQGTESESSQQLTNADNCTNGNGDFLQLFDVDPL